MKLSMSMLRWYLRDYTPEVDIRDDDMRIKGIRFLSAADSPFSTDYAYFGSAGNYFSDARYKNAYMIVSGQSRLMFFGCDYEALLNSLLAAFDYFISWENRLLEASSCHLPIRDMVDIAFEVIENSIAVDDTSTCRVFFSRESPKAKYDPYWTNSANGDTLERPLSADPMVDVNGQLVYDFSNEPQILKNFYEKGDPVMMMYIYSGQEPIAVLAVRQDDPSLTKMNEQLFPVLGKYFSQAEEFTSSDSELRSGVSVVRDLLSNIKVSPDTCQRFTQYRLHLPYRLIVLQHDSRRDYLSVSGLMKQIHRCSTKTVTLEYNDHIVCLTSGEKADLLLQELQQVYDLSHHLIGISMPILELYGVHTGYNQALFSLGRLNGKPGIAKCENYAFDYLVNALRDMPFANDLQHPAFRLLEQYDKENQGDLRMTLSVYLANQQNQNNTAKALHIHNNTLKYRLRRIREITGLTFEDHGELNYLRLSDWLSEIKIC